MLRISLIVIAGLLAGCAHKDAIGLIAEPTETHSVIKTVKPVRHAAVRKEVRAHSMQSTESQQQQVELGKPAPKKLSFKERWKAFFHKKKEK